MSKIGKIVKTKSGEESSKMSQSKNPVLPLQVNPDIPKDKQEIPQGTDYWVSPYPISIPKRKSVNWQENSVNHPYLTIGA